jgi:hypothetical protein
MRVLTRWRAAAPSEARVAAVRGRFPARCRKDNEAGLEARGRASVRVSGWKGGSPLQASPLRPVTDCNCVVARRGGEQQEVKKSSVGTRTRFGRTDWRACDRKAKPGPALRSGKPMTLKGWVRKRSWEAVRWLETEGFEGQTTLSGETCAVPASSRPVTGVRALIVAGKPGNAGGAKGCRKVEMHRPRMAEGTNRVSVPLWLNVPEKPKLPPGATPNHRSRTVPLLTAFVQKVEEDRECTLCSTPTTAWMLASSLCVGPSVPSWVKPPTGEPDAGDPHVRFGGRGRLSRSLPLSA